MMRRIWMKRTTKGWDEDEDVKVDGCDGCQDATEEGDENEKRAKMRMISYEGENVKEGMGTTTRMG